jgi:hypothetical protein
LHVAQSKMLDHVSIDRGRLLWREEDELAGHGWQPAPRTIYDRLAPAWWEQRGRLTQRLTNRNHANAPGVDERLDNWGYHALPANAYNAAERRNFLDIARGTIEPFMGKWSPEGPPVEILRMTLELCRRERIAALLVMSPEGPAAQSWYSAEAKSRVREFLDRFPASEGCPLVDAWNWLSEDDFLDSHHPDCNGATKYSARLTREFLLPRFRADSDGHGLPGPFLTTSAPRSEAKAGP